MMNTHTHRHEMLIAEDITYTQSSPSHREECWMRFLNWIFFQRIHAYFSDNMRKWVISEKRGKREKWIELKFIRLHKFMCTLWIRQVPLSCFLYSYYIHVLYTHKNTIHILYSFLSFVMSLDAITLGFKIHYRFSFEVGRFLMRLRAHILLPCLPIPYFFLYQSINNV